MAQDETKPDPVEPSEPAAPAERTYTADEVSQIVVKRLERERAKYQKVSEPAPAPQPEATSKGTPTDPRVDEMAETLASVQEQLLVQTVRAEAAKRGVVDDAAQDLLIAAYRGTKPDDIGTWIESAAGAFAPQAAETPTEPAQPANRAGPSDAGAPTKGRDPVDMADLPALTGDDIHRLKSEGRFREALDRYRNSMNGGNVTPFRNRLPKR